MMLHRVNKERWDPRASGGDRFAGFFRLRTYRRPRLVCPHVTASLPASCWCSGRGEFGLSGAVTISQDSIIEPETTQLAVTMFASVMSLVPKRSVVWWRAHDTRSSNSSLVIAAM